MQSEPLSGRDAGRPPVPAPRDAGDDAAPGGADVPLVLAVCSSGGHLAQLLVLRPALAAKRVRWVTFATPDATSQLEADDVVWAHHPTTRNARNLLRNSLLAWRLLRRERPDLVVSSGAGVAVPFFVLGRLLGVPTVWIEVFDRLDTPTLTGRLVRPFATRVLVQWEEQRGLYPGAEVAGTLL